MSEPALDAGAGGSGDRAVALVGRLRANGLTLATAESLTGGLLASELVAVAGASAVFHGGVIAYHSRVKVSLLGVQAQMLAELGAVDPLIATAMAQGVRRCLGSDVGVATTGAAGPEEHGGKPPGTVYVAVSIGTQNATEGFRFHADRGGVRAQAVGAALELTLRVLRAFPCP